MKTTKLTLVLLLMLFLPLIFFSSCNQRSNDAKVESSQADLSVLGKEIELRLREFEKNLLNGDSIALGDMYSENAVIMPSLKGRENIIKNFGGMIRDSITGSSFKTIHLWGNGQLLVEEGTGKWLHANGEVVGTGKYMVVWEKENGSWKILRDIWFQDKKK
jgi:ketosteroid isomerase-like protein